MFVAWTTVTNQSDADQLATGAVAENLAVCVQIEGPVTSHYLWQGKAEKAEEYRLTFKVLPAQVALLETWIHRHHPYDIPQWIVVQAEHVGEKYLSWAQANPNPLPL